MKSRILAGLFAGIALFLMAPSQASAQSTIQGTVKDSSGAVMAGVSVVASSPALIEGSRTLTTDNAGHYELVNVRPGTYSLKFSVTGFSSQEHNGVEVLADQTTAVNADMQVGSAGETVSVEATAPLVDTENATNHQVLTREQQDAIPAPRNMQALGGLTPGISLHVGQNSNPDVGGSQQMEQTYITGHGSRANEATILLDGMNINSNYLDGTIQNYVDNAIIQEATYQTVGATADVSAGGVVVNQIPKDGGNEFHSDVFLSGTGSGSPWQASNLSDSLKTKFAQFGVAPSVSKIEHIEDFDGNIGGPILKNKLWFLASGRYQSTYDSPPGIFYPNGAPGIEDQYIAQGVLRLSYQATSKDKISGTYNRIFKHKGHELANLNPTPDNPDISGQRRGGTLYYVGQVRWTRVQNSNVIMDGGFSTDIIHYSVVYQPGQEQVPFTPAWYNGVSKIDTATGFRSNAAGLQSFYLPDRRNINYNMTVIRGAHIIKFGVQDGWGKNDRVSSINGDLVENFSNGVPVSVTAYPTPIAIRQRVNADLGLYVMDTWHIKRLSITPGLRWEYEKSSILPSTVNPGRFIGGRNFGLVNCETNPGLGCWKTWSPRIGAAYDVFGNGKTAVKASFGKYYMPEETGYLTAMNPQNPAGTATLTWTACAPGQTIRCDVNGDGIAQDNELDRSQISSNFGLSSAIPKVDPNFKREYSLQYSAGVSHQIKPGMGISFTWFHRTEHNQWTLVNRAVNPTTDWTGYQVTNPLNGQAFTAYYLNPGVSSRASDLYLTNADSSKRQQIYTGFETVFNTALPKRGHLSVAWTADRNTNVACDMPIGSDYLGLIQVDGNGVTNANYNDPNLLRYCDERGQLPFRNELKVLGNIPLKWGIEASVVYQNDPELLKWTQWSVSTTTYYPIDAKGQTSGTQQLVNPALPAGTPAENLILSQPGSQFFDRLNQVDLGIKKSFKFREKYRIQLQADIFNVTNGSPVLGQTYALGTAKQSAANLTNPSAWSIAPFVSGNGTEVGGRPTAILQGRLLRLAMQFHF
jgi:hypothetical protein